MMCVVGTLLLGGALLTAHTPVDSRRELKSGCELHCHLIGNNPFFKTFCQHAPHRFSTTFRVIESQFVDPHPDKSVSQTRIHVSCKLHCVLKGALTMRQRICNAVPQCR